MRGGASRERPIITEHAAGERFWRRGYARLPNRVHRAARSLGVVRWGAAGLLLGAVLWNSVFMWNAVRGALPGFSRDLPVRQDFAPPGCTTLSLDRESGHTVAVPCAAFVPMHAEASPAVRADVSASH
jgi:hypothetical protein